MAKLFFFFLLFWSSFSNAQSIPATQHNSAIAGRYVVGLLSNEGVPVAQTFAPTVIESCQLGAAVMGWSFHSVGSANVCKYVRPGDSYFTDRQSGIIYNCNGVYQGSSSCSYYSCPSGYTLNGNMCDPEAPCPIYGTPEGNAAPHEKPSSCNCPEGSVWVPLNGCRAKCNTPYSNGDVVNANWPIMFAPGTREGCWNGCIVQQYQTANLPSYQYDDGTVSSSATMTGWACQTSNEPPPPDSPDAPEEPKEPPCPASHGVLTSSSGTVACVPNGTPSPRKPDVEVREKKETFPDNSEKVTKETKTTDPKTGASHTSTSTTSTGGLAGPAGTSSSSETSTGKGTGGDGGGDCEGDDCGEGDEYEPGEMPSTEGLYEKKYEDGISGVLNARFEEMQNTPLFGLVGTLVPSNLPNSGSCSPFSFSMNLGPGMNLGAGTLEVPCYVWDFIRLVMYISALLLARRLIFGG